MIITRPIQINLDCELEHCEYCEYLEQAGNEDHGHCNLFGLEVKKEVDTTNIIRDAKCRNAEVSERYGVVIKEPEDCGHTYINYDGKPIPFNDFNEALEYLSDKGLSLIEIQKHRFLYLPVRVD